MLNFCQLKGRIASDVEMKTVKGDKKLLQFSILYETPHKTDQEGSHANFMQVECWGRIVDIFEPLLFKGLEIVIYGQIVQKRWRDKSNKPASMHKFYASSVQISDLKFQGSEKAAA